MPVSNNWQNAYTELIDFIDKNSEVKIGADKVRLPANLRPEFWRLFNATRKAFVKEELTNLLGEARLLSENYVKAEQEVTKLLCLDDVSMENSLHRFLHDPIDELARGQFDLLFDLLKEKLDIQTFEERALKNIKASYRSLYRSGYEKWVALSIVKLLEADKLYQLTLRQIAREEKVRMRITAKEPVPPAKESKRLSFEHEQAPLLVVPDYIVHSTKINRYVSARSEYGAALATASNTSEQRKWYPLDTIVALEPGLNLYYLADKPEEISLVADAQKICKPDLNVECRGQKDWYEKEGLEKVKLHNYMLKPRLGSYIVSREPVPEQKLDSQEDIHLLTVGFDQSKLAPIIDAFMGYTGNDR